MQRGRRQKHREDFHAAAKPKEKNIYRQRAEHR
jgi:hypothetical protein